MILIEKTSDWKKYLNSCTTQNEHIKYQSVKEPVEANLLSAKLNVSCIEEAQAMVCPFQTLSLAR